MRKPLRQALTIARRDFVATVGTPAFLLFLLAPLLMAAVGALAGLGTSRAVEAGGRDDASRLVAIVPPATTAAMAGADRRLRQGLPDEALPPLTTLAPAPGAARRAAGQPDTAAVLDGPLSAPTILYVPRARRAADYLALLARETLADQALGAAAPRIAARLRRIGPPPARRRGGERTTGYFAVFGIFFLTLFLAGQVVGTMAEERTNKVIEILAAAVPLEAVFFGKLLGLFGVAVLFVVFWGVVVSQAGALVPGLGAAIGTLTPAVGVPAFAVLFVLYFTTAYLLLGAVFLGVGAQATTPREIQMLSLPITITQVAMFALASAAAAHPGSTLATVAQLFPLSSPFAMIGRAADLPSLWPHAAALAWQALWVAIFVTVGARLFRRGVLQSGGRRGVRRRRPVSSA